MELSAGRARKTLRVLGSEFGAYHRKVVATVHCVLCDPPNLLKWIGGKERHGISYCLTTYYYQDTVSESL